jgi:hypothetical protein
MSPTAGTACDTPTGRAPCPVIRASRTGAETFRGLTRVVHLLRAGMWLPDEAEVVHFPGPLGILVRRACTRQPPGWPEQTTVRPMAGKLIGSILIGFERAGCAFFVTEAERFARGGPPTPTGYIEPSTWRFTVPGGAMRAMVYRGPYKIRVEEKDIPALEHPPMQLSG